MNLRAVPAPVVTQSRKADVTWPTENKFLHGPFIPWSEQNEAYDLPVITGQIPAGLNGALFRIASNPRFRPRDVDRYHWWGRRGHRGLPPRRPGRPPDPLGGD